MISIHNDYILLFSLLASMTIIAYELRDILRRMKCRKRSKKMVFFKEPLHTSSRRTFRQIMMFDISQVRDSVRKIVYCKALKPLTESLDGVKHVTKSTDASNLQIIPGCETDGPNIAELCSMFPDVSKQDLMRFLVARKGSVSLAAEMFSNARAWLASHVPASISIAGEAAATKCLFIGKPANDGTITIYFRSALFDSRAIPSEAFVTLAAHCMDYAFKYYNSKMVTVMVDITSVPGAPNLSADITFIKLFVKCMSDVFPERLKKLLVYPFPWYGKALWSLIAVFLDQRTREKVILCSLKGDEHAPEEVFKYVSQQNIPSCCGGTDHSQLINVMATLRNDGSSNLKGSGGVSMLVNSSSEEAKL